MESAFFLGGSEAAGDRRVIQHLLQKVTVDEEAFDLSALRSLWQTAIQSGAGLGNFVGLSGGSWVSSATEQVMSAVMDMGGVGGGVDGDLENEDMEVEEEELRAAVGSPVYAQRVLLLLKALHADVPALLQRELTRPSVLSPNLVVEGQLQEPLLSGRVQVLQALASLRALVRQARVVEQRDCVYSIQHLSDGSLRVRLRYMLGFPVVAALADLPLVPTVKSREEKDKLGEEGGEEEGRVLPLNVEAMVGIRVNSAGRIGVLQLSSLKFNGQSTLPEPLKALASSARNSQENFEADDRGAGTGGRGSGGAVRDAAVSLLRTFADLLQ